MQAFCMNVFPPIYVKTERCVRLKDGDKLPQFEVVRKGTRYSYNCVTCQYYEQSTNNKCKSNSKSFEGVKQMYTHGSSMYHLQGLQFLLNTNASISSSKSDIMSQFLGKKKSSKTDCLHIFDKYIVAEFKDDQAIHRMSFKSLFDAHSELHCKEHPTCSDHNVWRVVHPDQYKILKTKPNHKAVFLPIKKNITIGGQSVNIDGAIQSVQPLCTGTAQMNGQHPFQCQSCYKQEQYLKNVMLKREKARLDIGVRIGKKGMRDDYLRSSELQFKKEMISSKSSALKKENHILKKQIKEVESNESLVNKLYSDCMNEDN